MQTDSFEAYTIILFKCQDHFLFLERSMEKSFAPGMWSGVGGHVETDEYDRLRESALREVEEETGLRPADIADFRLRRAVFVARRNQPLKLLLYFTGSLSRKVTPLCPEGTLHWKEAREFEELAIIETTRPVLPLLARDMDIDEHGQQPVTAGLAVFRADGMLSEIVWAE